MMIRGHPDSEKSHLDIQLPVTIERNATPPRTINPVPSADDTLRRRADWGAADELGVSSDMQISFRNQAARARLRLSMPRVSSG
jgi:hypothetical protein